MPTDLDLHCLQRQSISGFSRTKVNIKPFGKIKTVQVQIAITRELSRFFACGFLHHHP